MFSFLFSLKKKIVFATKESSLHFSWKTTNHSRSPPFRHSFIPGVLDIRDLDKNLTWMAIELQTTFKYYSSYLKIFHSLSKWSKVTQHWSCSFFYQRFSLNPRHSLYNLSQSLLSLTHTQSASTHTHTHTRKHFTAPLSLVLFSTNATAIPSSSLIISFISAISSDCIFLFENFFSFSLFFNSFFVVFFSLTTTARPFVFVSHNNICLKMSTYFRLSVTHFHSIPTKVKIELFPLKILDSVRKAEKSTKIQSSLKDECKNDT